jgi:Polyketide cyclase / dehydrase and lipid transport
MRVESSATIDQPVDRVFDYVSTPENDRTWVPASLRHEMLSPAPMRVGSITEEDVWFLVRRMRYVWEIIQYEPPTAFAAQSISGPIPATIRVLLESLDGARTKVILVGEVQLRGVYKPMELVMRLVARRQLGTQLRKLKNLLESEGALH